MDALDGSDFGGPSSDDHISALVMHERFFGGPPAKYDESRQAFHRAASAIRAYNSSLPLPERSANGVNDDRFFGRIHAMLDDANVSLDPAARHALRLCVNGFQYFNPPLVQGLSVPFSLKI
jgi:hypothetical protein